MEVMIGTGMSKRVMRSVLVGDLGYRSQSKVMRLKRYINGR